MSVGEAVEYLSGEDADDVPDKLFVWGSRRIPFSLNAGNIVDDELDNHHEDAEVSGTAVKELQEFFDHWCDIYDADVRSYEPAYDVLVTGVAAHVVEAREVARLNNNPLLPKHGYIL